MAEFLWTFAVQEVLKKMVKLAAEQMGLAWGFEKELSKLRDSLDMAQDILRDVDKIKADLVSLKRWVKKLEDIVFEVDDLLDELAYEDVRRKVETGKDLMVRNFFSSSKNPFAFRLKMANKITAVAEKLNEHYSTKSPVGYDATIFNEAKIDLSQILETDSFLDEIRIIGRETEVSNIVNDLVAGKSQETLVVLSIVGTGGLGKTTLVKEIFHHEMIRKNFDTTMWVCVSHPFNINKILRAMVGNFNANFGGSDEREVILQELKKLLTDKKYFLVLDDVWNDNSNLWSELRACLLKINQNFGSAIVVTTRSDKAAEIMESHYTHHLKLLPSDHCWSLFEKCAFGGELPIISNVIREELVKKFGGIPLVVKVLGGIVKSYKNDEELQSTLKNLMRIALKDEDHILYTIKLSVDRLPFSSLKQCFAYCSNFPPDFDIDKEELVQMWIAQGFIQLDNESNLLEDTGAKYFDILLSRSLFQDVYKDERGKIISCKMYDLIYNVACSISNYKILRLGLEMNEKFQDDKVLSISERRRTVYWSKNVPFDNLGRITNFIYLRVLIIDSWSICELPDSIGKLKHLRYLDISQTRIRELPKSFVLLYNLQTLNFGGYLKELPTNLRKLVNLRHLEFGILSKIKQMPKHLSLLTQLQTLSGFVVRCDEGCKIEELGPLKHLKGEISILCLEQVKSKKEAMAANLKEKENISNLCFKWSSSEKREDWNENDDLNVLEGLQPHKNLQVLTIQRFAGEVLPNGIFVDNLVELYLFECYRCETLPMLGQLSKLKVLEIFMLDIVKSIGDEFYGNYRDSRTLFPELKFFLIYGMDNLESWEEIATLSNCTTFPHLETLCIGCCPKLTNIPNIFATHSQRLEVDNVNARLFPSFQSPLKLRFLSIFRYQNLTKLPNWLELCNSLKKLVIGDLPDHISPPNLQNFQNLSSLTIVNFQNLPAGLACLHNLKELDVEGPMQGYDWSPFIQFNLLEDLRLLEIGIDCLTHLPRQFEHLTALKFLRIEGFDGVESLPEWFGNVTSLEILELSKCKNLKSLPSKEVMSNLTRLQKLRVHKCSQLNLCEGGFEHAKVSHVPNVNVL